MKNIFLNFSIIVILILAVSSCVERRYYRVHRYHRPVYYHRHHMTPPPGVNINIRG